MKYIRKIKNPEEFFGAIGLAYLIILIALAVIFVRTIVNLATDSLRVADSSIASIPSYNIEQAEEILAPFLNEQ